MSLLAALLQGGVAGYGYGQLIDDVKAQRTAAQDTMEGIKGDVGQYTNFLPYSVKSGLGSFSQMNGDTTSTLSDSQAMQSQERADFGSALAGQSMFGDFNLQSQAYDALGASQQAMARSMQDPTQREQDIYGRIRDMQRPGEQRQYESMNAGLFSSGRGGMATDAYGGSPEQHAFGMAQAEARNAASLQAMQQAQNEMMNQGQLASSFGGMGQQGLGMDANIRNTLGGLSSQFMRDQYLPYEQLRQESALGMQGAGMYNQANQTTAGLLAQLGLGGLTADINYSNILGNATSGMLEMLGTAVGGTDFLF